MNKVEKSAIPVAFFLLPCEEQICHSVMFEAFHEASVDINPEYWLLDHEIGTSNAVKEVFASATRLWYRDALFTGRDASVGRCKSWAWWRLSTTTRRWPSGSGAGLYCSSALWRRLAMLLTLVLPSTMSLSCHHHHLLGQAYSHLYDYVYVVS